MSCRTDCLLLAAVFVFSFFFGAQIKEEIAKEGLPFASYLPCLDIAKTVKDYTVVITHGKRLCNIPKEPPLYFLECSTEFFLDVMNKFLIFYWKVQILVAPLDRCSSIWVLFTQKS